MEYSIDDFIANLPKGRQKKIKNRFQKVKGEYLALRELRKAMKLTQEQIAQELDMGQGNLSRLEQRSDLLISTLRRYIEAMGGTLRIVAQFPKRPPVEISSFSEPPER